MSKKWTKKDIDKLLPDIKCGTFEARLIKQPKNFGDLSSEQLVNLKNGFPSDFTCSFYIPMKPISVNNCWQGKRFKTKEYKQFAERMKHTLVPSKLPNAPYSFELVFGFSNKAADIDNPIKPTFDILQEKYGFNDKEIYQLNVRKEIVKKGDEFIKIKISTYNPLK